MASQLHASSQVNLCQLALNWRILLEKSFTACMHCCWQLEHLDWGEYASVLHNYVTGIASFKTRKLCYHKDDCAMRQQK